MLMSCHISLRQCFREAVDLLAFERMLAYLHQRRDEWSPNVSRQVVLHRGGYAHAVVVGMFQLLRPNHQVLFFDDSRRAFESIGAADVHEELESIRQVLLGTPEIVRRVQAAAAVHCVDPACAAVERLCSPRQPRL